MTIFEILRQKGDAVHTISPGATLGDVVQKLVACNCGSLVVCDEDAPTQMLGIVTERDILRACASHRGPLELILVSEVMSSRVITGSHGDSLETIMGLMTRERIRHLPVLEEDQLVGLISIGDIVKAQHDALTMENHYLKEYIHS